MHPILVKYDKRLEDYNNSFMPLFIPLMKDGKKPFSKLFKGLFDFYVFTNYLLDQNIIPKKQEVETLRQLFASASKSFYGVNVLLQHGLSLNAAVVTRQLLETMLNIKLILKEDTEERIILYNNFIYAARWYVIDRDKKLLNDNKITQKLFDKNYTTELIEKTNKDYEKIKDDYKTSSWYWKILKNKGYKSGSIRNLAKEVDHAIEYDKIYGLLSKIAHGNTVSLHLVNKTSAPTFIKENTVYIAFISLGYMSDIIKTITNKYVESTISEEINIYCDAYCVSLDENWDN